MEKRLAKRGVEIPHKIRVAACCCCCCCCITTSSKIIGKAMVRSVMGRAYPPERRKKQKGKAYQSALTNRKAFTLEPDQHGGFNVRLRQTGYCWRTPNPAISAASDRSI